MSARRLARMVMGAIVHNWPLKVAALALAALLYVGLVATQDSSVYPGPITVTYVHLPPDSVVTNQLKDVEQIRYLAPADVGHLTGSNFQATVDLANVQPTGTPVSLPVDVQADDPRVTIIDVKPRTVTVILDKSAAADVPVTVVKSESGPGVTVGETVFTPQQARVLGPAAAVGRVVAVRVTVTLDPSGLNYDQEVEGVPVDIAGAPVTGVTVVPATFHVQIPQITNGQTRSLPVNPVLSGDPAPGFRVSGIAVSPATVLVQGDATQLVKMIEVDTAPVGVFGATRDVSSVVALSLPTGVAVAGGGTVTVTVHVAALTDTRTLAAGFRLDGQQPGMAYTLNVDSALLTLYGSTADLDRLASVPLVVGLDVAGMGPGKHQVTVVPSLPSGVTLVAVDPTTVTVDIGAPSPAPSDVLPSPVPLSPGLSPAPSPS